MNLSHSQSRAGMLTGMWQSLRIYKRDLENLWEAFDPPTAAKPQGMLQERDVGLPLDPPVSGWILTGTSSSPAAAPPAQPREPRGTIPVPAVLDGVRGWDGMGWAQ